MRLKFTPCHYLEAICYLVAVAIFLCVGTFITPQAVTASSKNSVMQVIDNAQEPYENKSVQGVQQVTEETILARERYRGRPFRVLARKKHIERFRCSSCHTDKKITVKKGAELTHGSIQLSHGQEGALTCIDCHHSEQRDFLEDKKGNKIDFDHSYQLCGQCHFRQKSDWLGGAHGKRVQYWSGERVVYNCATCHNPHSPRFEKRFPVIYSKPAP